MAGKGLNDIISEWDFSSKHVEPNITSGKFISSKTSLIVAVDNPETVVTNIINGQSVNVTGTAVGLVSNWNITQQKMIQQLFEVGSSVPYFIPGNTVGQLNLGRVIFGGPTLLSRMYKGVGLDDTVGFKIGNASDYFSINLAAKAFDKPTTLLWVIKNNESETIGSFLLVNTMVEALQIGGDAQSVVIMESATARFERIASVSITG